jgi:predicted site-specific integrase-resolvase
VKDYTPREVAAMLGVTARTAEDWLARGILRGRKTDAGAWVVPGAELVRYCRARCLELPRAILDSPEAGR